MFDSSTTIAQFLNATAAKTPTPGGGSVSALVAAEAAALGEMVINYSLNKKGLEAFADELKPALAEMNKARSVLLQLMVEDQLAYDAFSAARKLPEAERQDKFPAALLTCVRVPETIAATGVAILEICDRLVNFVNYYLLSDLAVCADLAMAAIRCATYSVRSNLSAMDDPADRQSTESITNQLLHRALTLIQSAAPRIWERIQGGP